MVRKTKIDQMGEDLGKDPAITGKSFKPGSGKFDSLKKPGDVLTGVFLEAKIQNIEDQRTHRPKDIFVLKIRNEQSQNVYKIPCAAMMLQAWDDIIDEYGNGD